uniref:Gonadotropin-releasing hormone 2 n=1 Tax=Oncorhynchus mykiss TaxID=8022 RepID=A0A8K9XJG8_ONCMY
MLSSPTTSLSLHLSIPLHSDPVMVSVARLVFMLGLLLCLGAQLSSSQHWSHGWYPGGKRELDSFTTSEVGHSTTISMTQMDITYSTFHQESRRVFLAPVWVTPSSHLCHHHAVISLSQISEEIKLCEAGECSYLRPQRRNILKNVILDALAREFQKRK